ncbi:hypothetical protein B0H10DRAFT_2009142, partial [Mycena sp. CBHHK59/15]
MEVVLSFHTYVLHSRSAMSACLLIGSDALASPPIVVFVHFVCDDGFFGLFRTSLIMIPLVVSSLPLRATCRVILYVPMHL